MCLECAQSVLEGAEYAVSALFELPWVISEWSMRVLIVCSECAHQHSVLRVCPAYTHSVLRLCPESRVLRLSWTILDHLTTSWTKSDQLGLSHLGPFVTISDNIAPFLTIQAYLCPQGTISDISDIQDYIRLAVHHVPSPKTIWDHLGQSVTVWDHLSPQFSFLRVYVHVIILI